MQNGNLTFNNDHHDGFWIYFHIDDPNGMGYLFPGTLADAMYSAQLVNPGDKCPTSGTWGGFEPKKLEDEVPKTGRFKTLKVRDPNSKKYVGQFGYTLCVVKTLPDGSDDWWQLDPVGDNANGPTSLRMFSTTAILVGVAAVAICALVLYEFNVFG
jgi:hypothetical protein